jgi:hypothetical protein
MALRGDDHSEKDVLAGIYSPLTEQAPAHGVTGCDASRNRLHLARRTTADRVPAHRKSDRRRDDLCEGGLRKNTSDIFRNASARRRSRCSTRALNRGDSAVCESHFNATLPSHKL